MMTALSLSVADLSAAHSQGMTHHYAPTTGGENGSFSTHVTSVHPAVMHQRPSHPMQQAMQPVPPSFLASPSKNPCMVRVHGVQGAANSRYRNDPYSCSVLPPLNNNANQLTQHSGSLSNRRLAPLPAALQVAAARRTSGFHPRAKADIVRAQEFAVDGGVSSTSTSPDSTISTHQHFLPTTQPQATTGHQQQSPGQPQWAMVRLKHEVLLYNLSLAVEVGDFVVLEGDRGENIGRIHSLIHDVPQHPVQCRVVRKADERDIEAVRVQREKEEAAKHFAQGVSDALQLGIRVVDTEFQTDGNKLTIFFTSRRQIDFRRLQRQMFKQYRCRIWLVNWTDVIKVSQ